MKVSIKSVYTSVPYFHYYLQEQKHFSIFHTNFSSTGVRALDVSLTKQNAAAF
jgi:hypothetical protein